MEVLKEIYSELDNIGNNLSMASLSLRLLVNQRQIHAKTAVDDLNFQAALRQISDSWSRFSDVTRAFKSYLDLQQASFKKAKKGEKPYLVKKGKG